MRPKSTIEVGAKEPCKIIEEIFQMKIGGLIIQDFMVILVNSAIKPDLFRISLLIFVNCAIICKILMQCSMKLIDFNNKQKAWSETSRQWIKLWAVWN